MTIEQNDERAALAPTPSGQQALSDEQLCAIEYAERALRAIAERREQIGDTIEPMSGVRASKRAAEALRRLKPVIRAILATAAPATADAPQRHSWTLEGMKRDPQGVWVLASHVGTADAPEVKQ